MDAFQHFRVCEVTIYDFYSPLPELLDDTRVEIEYQERNVCFSQIIDDRAANSVGTDHNNMIKSFFLHSDFHLVGKFAVLKKTDIGGKNPVELIAVGYCQGRNNH